MNKFLLPAFIFVLFLSCKEQSISEQKNEILSLKEMSELATAEYTITKVVKANDNKTWFKLGNRKILLSCTGSIKAGIDFSKLSSDDITIKNNDVVIILQPAKILYLNIPPENIKLEFQQVGFWRDNFNLEEQNELLKQAEMQIKSAADSIGITMTAEKNAKVFVTDFLRRLGYSNVTITINSSPYNTKQPG